MISEKVGAWGAGKLDFTIGRFEPDSSKVVVLMLENTNPHTREYES